MKAITLHQPWASLIAFGLKPFETRSWTTRYRGPLAIHAARTTRGLAGGRGMQEIEAALAAAGERLETLPLGVVVCTACLDAVWPTEAVVADGLADAFGDYAAGRYAWYLRDIRRLDPPVPARGRQGLSEWTP